MTLPGLAIGDSSTLPRRLNMLFGDSSADSDFNPKCLLVKLIMLSPLTKDWPSLSSTPIDQECCVFKVHRSLRQINPAAYEPDLLAIGPYHRGKDHLSFMEKHKLIILQRMLKRRNENSAKRYITAMIEKEERARRFYADQFPELSKVEFVEMMLLDGCFIIELFRDRSQHRG
ncbi:UPF0481 protein At3g47200-like [Juglans regia]|uniref:UPF0481 protein At3g47200-like n=1 Tax=Juglans regia TaxID=51240 RepID=A0A6P9EUI3_JUGRE|nr:UPF0481 protein At3g47200-like [Juglans regia]